MRLEHVWQEAGVKGAIINVWRANPQCSGQILSVTPYLDHSTKHHSYHPSLAKPNPRNYPFTASGAKILLNHSTINGLAKMSGETEIYRSSQRIHLTDELLLRSNPRCTEIELWIPLHHRLLSWARRI
jgi:hypothetical protein